MVARNLDSLRLVESRPGVGEVGTPISLVNEMLDKLPNEVFTSSTTTFLDPCFGEGTFIIDIVRRLRAAGHSMDNIEKRVFGVEISQPLFNRVSRKLNRYNFTLLNTDSLKYDFKDMKFDVIIGNPPYQLKESNSRNTKLLFTEFTYKAKEVGRHVLFVIPSNYLEGNKGPLKTFRKFIKSNGLEFISEDKSQYFEVNTAGISYIKLGEGKTDKYLFADKVVVNNYDESKIVSDFEVNNLYTKLLSKESKLNVSRGKRNIYIKSTEQYVDCKAEDYTVPMFLKTIKGEPKQVYVKPDTKADVTASHFALVTQDWNKKLLQFNNIWYRTDKMFTSNLNFIYFILEASETFESFISYTKSNLFRFLLKNTDNGSRAISIGSLKQFPKLPFNTTWTDEKVYKYFNLTQEEINLIESTVA